MPLLCCAPSGLDKYILSRWFESCNLYFYDIFSLDVIFSIFGFIVYMVVNYLNEYITLILFNTKESQTRKGQTGEKRMFQMVVAMISGIFVALTDLSLVCKLQTISIKLFLFYNGLTQGSECLTQDTL